MNAKTAICISLLRGDVLSNKNGFRDFGVIYLTRELIRMVEEAFHVKLSRVHKVSKSRWGTPCSYTEYRLNQTEYNSEGIKKIKLYVDSNKGPKIIPKKLGRPPKKDPPPNFNQDKLF